MKKAIQTVFSLFILLIFLLTHESCDDNVKNEKNQNLFRFDLDLLEFDTSSFEKSENFLLKKYPEIYPFYIERLMGMGNIGKEPKNYYYGNYFPEFHSGEYSALMDSFKNRISEREIESNISKTNTAYEKLNKIFLCQKSPKIFSFMISPMAPNSIAAFSYGEDTIGINWFHYLGKNFAFYRNIFENYSYMLPWKDIKYLPRNIMLVEFNLLDQKFNFSKEYNELIFNMINEGKKYYFLDEVCEVGDEIKIGYTENQLEWCQKNEYEIWAFFKDKKLLYNTDRHQHIKYLKEGPSTNGMPKESPGMVGTWVGWQIIKKYAESSNKSALEILQTDAKDILTSAKYKPKK